MATHSSILAWRIPWTEEPGGLLSMGSHRVGHNWRDLACMCALEEGNGNPLQYSCLENPRDREAWWGAICGVAQNQTQLKQLNSSSSSNNMASFLVEDFLSQKQQTKFLSYLISDSHWLMAAHPGPNSCPYGWNHHDWYRELSRHPLYVVWRELRIEAFLNGLDISSLMLKCYHSP